MVAKKRRMSEIACTCLPAENADHRVGVWRFMTSAPSANARQEPRDHQCENRFVGSLVNWVRGSPIIASCS